MKRLFWMCLISLFLFALNNCTDLTGLTTAPVATTTASTAQTTASGILTTLSTTAPTTSAPTTLAPTSIAPTTAVPTTEATTAIPTTTTTLPVITTTTPTTTTAPTTTAPTTVITTTAPTTTTPTTNFPTTEIPTTEEPTTTESGTLSISEILSAQPVGTFQVQGTVFYKISTPDRLSYYIYDGTGSILVIDSNSVTIGDSVEFTATYDYSEPAPQLMNVTGFTDSLVPASMPSYTVSTIADIVSHTGVDRTEFGRTLTITGTLQQPNPMMLRLVSGSDFVVLDSKSFVSGNPLIPLIGQTVTLNVVVHSYLSGMMTEWHVLYQSHTQETE